MPEPSKLRINQQKPCGVAALLLSALRRAKMKARQAVCSSRPRRINLGIFDFYFATIVVTISFLAVLVLALTACAPKNEPARIDKSQIDLTSLMVQDLDSPPKEENYYNLLYPGNSPKHPGTNVLFHLLGAAQPGSLGTIDLFRLAGPLETNAEKLLTLSGRNVQITDGGTLLATGRVNGWVGGPGDWHVKVRLDSPDTAKALGRLLRPRRPELNNVQRK